MEQSWCVAELMPHWHPTHAGGDGIHRDAPAKPAEPVPVQGQGLLLLLMARPPGTSAPGSPCPRSLPPSLLLEPYHMRWGGPAPPSSPTGRQSRTRPRGRGVHWCRTSTRGHTCTQRDCTHILRSSPKHPRVELGPCLAQYSVPRLLGQFCGSSEKTISELSSPRVDVGKVHHTGQPLSKRSDGRAKPCKPRGVRKQLAPRQTPPSHASIGVKRGATRHLQPRGDQAGKPPHRGRQAALGLQQRGCCSRLLVTNYEQLSSRGG